MKTKLILLLSVAMLVSGVLAAQELPSAGTATTLPTAAPTMMPQGPMSLDDVITALKKKEAAEDLIKDLKSRGVDFEVDPEIEKKLHKAKASDEVMKAVKDAGPKERTEAARAAAIQSGATVFTKEEAEDLRAVEAELDPDKAISLVEEAVKKYPDDKVFQSYAYVFEAYAYEKKNDAEKAYEYAEKSLTLKKDNLLALLTITHIIPQTRYIDKHQADEDKLLAEAKTYSEDAEKAVGDLKKLDTESDADLAGRKDEYLCGIHADRGMIHLDLAQEGLLSVDKDQLSKAVDEYTKAVSCPQPLPADYFRLGDAYRMLGKTDDAIAAFTKASELGQGVVKQYADQQIAALKAAKAGAGSPSK